MCTTSILENKRFLSCAFQILLVLSIILVFDISIYSKISSKTREQPVQSFASFISLCTTRGTAFTHRYNSMDPQWYS